ncbi:cytochrome oxidase assembly [Histoplasma capsulatum]|uniref:Cytochrome oxidase assembly n=1 Tax=Ajellomyces capsulatus TaxID=5037 RepID=A0A8A1M6X1_AJECA|nr:cytochrome oxidase assembly [Histoplasma capsulatum]
MIRPKLATNILQAAHSIGLSHRATFHPAPTCRLLRRTLTSASRLHSGPLLSRRADRELPSIKSGRTWLRTLPIFFVVVGASMLGIFNYQKSSSSIVNSTLYALRVSPKGRELLGDEIYFAQKIPWISGEMNQLHGRIDISFWVKGTKGKAKMRFQSTRDGRNGYFQTNNWSLTLEDGTIVSLLDASQGDPFRSVMSGDSTTDLKTSI